MHAHGTSGRGILYLVLALLAALCLYLFGWPIARQVILHRGDPALEEPEQQGKGPTPASGRPEPSLPEEP